MNTEAEDIIATTVVLEQAGHYFGALGVFQPAQKLSLDQ